MCRCGYTYEKKKWTNKKRHRIYVDRQIDEKRNEHIFHLLSFVNIVECATKSNEGLLMVTFFVFLLSLFFFFVYFTAHIHINTISASVNGYVCMFLCYIFIASTLLPCLKKTEYTLAHINACVLSDRVTCFSCWVS